MCKVCVVGGELTQEETDAYVAYAREKYGRDPLDIAIRVDGEYVDLNIRFYEPFDRIRRITGYLVGSLDRFNNAKRSEEHDRVKHA